MKKVSIIIPVWGVEKYISKCLDSLVNQTLEDIEIIVVNDGSPDNSQKIIDEYVKKYPDKVKSYIKENGGQGSARNYGIEVSTGEYIGFVDSDDFVELDMFEKMYNKAKQDKSDIVVCGSYNVSEDYSNKEKDVFVANYDTDLENVIFGKMAVWNKIYRINIIIDNKITFKEKVWYEDLAFTLKAIINSTKFSFTLGSGILNGNHLLTFLLRFFPFIQFSKARFNGIEYFSLSSSLSNFKSFSAKYLLVCDSKSVLFIFSPSLVRGFRSGYFPSVHSLKILECFVRTNLCQKAESISPLKNICLKISIESIISCGSSFHKPKIM